MINSRTILITATILLALGVLFGAFGAHGLKSAPVQILAWWQTATLYLFIHALGMLFVGILNHLSLCNHRPAILLGLGIVIFSGSLYAMALGLPRWLGVITPIGGMLFVIGWLYLAWQLYQKQSS